jgi:hypothetical protein
MAVVLPPNATVGSFVGAGAKARLSFIVGAAAVLAWAIVGAAAVLAWSTGEIALAPAPK